jgi:hypothetical protein
MCTKVAHLKGGEVRLRSGSSFCNRAISISSARGHEVYIVPLDLNRASKAFEQTGQTGKLLSAAKRPDHQARRGLHGS